MWTQNTSRDSLDGIFHAITSARKTTSQTHAMRGDLDDGSGFPAQIPCACYTLLPLFLRSVDLQRACKGKDLGYDAFTGFFTEVLICALLLRRMGVPAR